MEGFKRIQSNGPFQQSMDQSTDSDDQQLNQVVEDMAAMDLQYHPVDEAAPSSYAEFVAQLPSGRPAAAANANYQQPIPMNAFNYPEQVQPIPMNGNHIDEGNDSGRNDSGIEMGEPSESIAKRLVRSVHAVDQDGEHRTVHFYCGLCKCMFERIELLHEHLALIHGVRLQ